MKIIILAGGSGTRLWPLSRTYYPKQFLKLKGMDKSIFQLTIERCLRLTKIENIYIVTNSSYRFLIAGQIEELGSKIEDKNIVCEPQAKNTLPAIFNGVREIQKDCDDVVAVFSSDHLIDDVDAFVSCIRSGEKLAKDKLITFGVCPTSPETGYGYLKPGEPVENGFVVDEFKEKPDLETAKTYVKNGYLWNSGMFMFRTDVFVEEVKKYAPEVYNAFLSDDIEQCFQNTPSISIDYGIMERSNRVLVIPLKIQWNDLGSFATFYDEYDSEQDQNGNVYFNNEVMIDAYNNMVYSDGDKAIAVIGVKDLVVVDQKDAILICNRNQTQKVKDAVEKLKVSDRRRVDYHLTEYRPWGWFTILEESNCSKISRLCILPGRRQSCQMHYHRSEHYIVVVGTANVTIDGVSKLVRTGESIFVLSGQKHRLENPSKILELNVIEVQSGAYISSDDKVRFEDDYGRV